LPVTYINKVHNPNLIPRRPLLHSIVNGKHPYSARIVHILRRILGVAGVKVEEILATKYKRKVFAENFRSKYREMVKGLDAVKTNEAAKLQKKHDLLDSLRVRHPGRVMIVDFNALIESGTSHA
jgi:hypothetical protein